VSRFWVAVLLAQTALVLLLAVVVLGQLRRVAVVLEAAEAALRSQAAPPAAPGLAPGATVPAFAARDPAGAPLAAAAPGGSPAVYLFVSGDCDACEPLLAELAGVADPLGGVRLVLVADPVAVERPTAGRVDALLVRQERGEVAAAFQATATPSAFAVDAAGTVVDARVVNTLAHLRELSRGLAPGRG
jgi:hypothetical protein